MKVCGKCGVEKDVAEFSLKKGKPQSYCKTCHSKYRKEHYLKNKQKYIDKAKRIRKAYSVEFYNWLNKQSCKDCGNTDTRVLEMDHLRDKSFTIGTRIGHTTLETMMKEVDKCEVVCANCHRIRTVDRAKTLKSTYAPLV